jgi:Zn-dependent M28 family amino/carboxypeptidase
VDNGSALVALLALTDALPADAPIALLFTDAEELGLQGARALTRDHPDLLTGAAVVNFDGLDDGGRTLMLAHRMGPRTEAIGRALGARLARRLPVLVDGMALAPFTAECVTIMRGTWATARVVHTPRDTVERLSLAGVESIVRVVAGALSPA